MKVQVPTDAAAVARRGLHDLALAALIGGNLFGRVAMHPALTDVSDEAERGKVLNRAWRRYGTVNSLALGTLVAGWLPARLNGTSPWRTAAGNGQLARAEDIAMAAVIVTGLASAASGVGFAQQAPGGAVPMRSGHDPAPQTPPRAARIKRVVNGLSAANLVAGLGLVAVDAAGGQERAGRSPARWPRRR